ncbi:nicotinate (nicotinamide) nucleotide adenylyltransferase [Alteromonas sp. KUL49]|uniref:nicotinate (nicotinamide) nucleotide adenylyltransferase n=1 Tax=Alteromonas sp. KUL49 TaxID=2480798 RepID=UPI0010FFB43B|nr:nicotinate (nicotinamide) nucleotide adenylyltransferase [Alteromonas sp. KUL49]GEA13297.1 putative nicotinate-nucleotide adenylyltransferase [Alteromonas sp. KUL49]
MSISAILGGTFNPPHHGHITPALEVATHLGIKKLGLMPCKIAPHKPVQVEQKHRVNMVKVLCETDQRLYPELIELELPSPSYTVKTLKALKQRDKHTICFFIGADSLYTLHKWYVWETLLDYCHIVVMRRDDQQYSPPDHILPWLEAHTTTDVNTLHTAENGYVYLANSGLVTVSSTELRTKIQHEDDDNMQQWLSQPVLDYIRHHKLYKKK